MKQKRDKSKTTTKSIPYTIVFKSIKYMEISLMTKVKDLYKINCKPPLKEKTQTNENTPHLWIK